MRSCEISHLEPAINIQLHLQNATVDFFGSLPEQHTTLKIQTGKVSRKSNWHILRKTLMSENNAVLRVFLVMCNFQKISQLNFLEALPVCISNVVYCSGKLSRKSIVAFWRWSWIFMTGSGCEILQVRKFSQYWHAAQIFQFYFWILLVSKVCPSKFHAISSIFHGERRLSKICMVP